MRIPYYYKSIDFESLVREYPPAEEFAETVLLYGPKEIEELQNRRFLAIVEHAWDNPFYRRKWETDGLNPHDIKSKDDIRRLPMVAVEDFKEQINAKPPFGEHQGLSTADAARIPIKIQSSGGTTGKPRPTLFTPWEWEMQGIQGSRGLYVRLDRPQLKNL